MAVQFKFSLKKAQAAVAYLAHRKIADLDVYKVCKLIFLADKLHLVRYGRTITGDAFFAFVHGPAPTNIYDLLKPDHEGNGEFIEPFQIDKTFTNWRYSLKEPSGVDFSILSRSDKNALDLTIERYSLKTFGELRAMTHEFPEYRHAWWERRQAWEKSSLMRFEEFFEEDPDAIEGTLNEVLENHQIREQLGAEKHTD